MPERPAVSCDGTRAPTPARRATAEQSHTPGFAQYIVTGRSSGSPSSFPVPAFPCAAQWRSIKVVRLTAAGAAPDWRAMKIARVTGFPFHPPADKREDTIHVSTRILHATTRRCTGFQIGPAMVESADTHDASCRVYAHRINIFRKLDFKLPSRLLLTLSCTAPTGPRVRGQIFRRVAVRVPHACCRPPFLIWRSPIAFFRGEYENDFNLSFCVPF
jgi:hypothetical protein